MPWLTTEEAAEILDYHVESVRRMLRKGKFKAKKFGPIWMIDSGSVHKFKAKVKFEGMAKRDPRRRS